MSVGVNVVKTMRNLPAYSASGVKGVRLAASDKITMSIRDFTATAGKIEFTFKLFN